MEMFPDTLLDHLGIGKVILGDDYLSAAMPVDRRTRQPFGQLHGGASVALAETLASLGANCVLNTGQNIAVGLAINANHLRPVSDGEVTGTARPVHLGRRTQVWQVDIVDDNGKAVCVSRVTMAVVPRPAVR